jgi:NAD(P)H-hydrate epimerase
MDPAAPGLDLIRTVPALPPRAAGANKGDYGRVLAVAGSRGMSGAAVLCAGAALRGGAGLVRLALPESVLPIVAAANPCYMTVPLPEDRDGRLSARALAPLVEAAPWATAIALGPGLGQSADVTAVVLGVLGQTTVPLVVDADGLNAVAPHLDVLSARTAPTVLTPHPGEFARLLGCTTADVQAQRQEAAVAFATSRRVVVALKGHGTVVTDGRRVFVNTTGNPGMATGGTGDVLTGLICALLAQGLEAFTAAQVGVYLHGLAGDLARDDLGEAGLIASDLLGYLPRAFKAHARQG